MGLYRQRRKGLTLPAIVHTNISLPSRVRNADAVTRYPCRLKRRKPDYRSSNVLTCNLSVLPVSPRRQKRFGGEASPLGTATRLVYAIIALLFALAAAVVAHVAAWLALQISAGFTFYWTALTIGGFDLLIALILLTSASRSAPSRIETEALAVRRRALAGLTTPVSMAQMLIPTLRLVLPRAAPRSPIITPNSNPKSARGCKINLPPVIAGVILIMSSLSSLLPPCWTAIGMRGGIATERGELLWQAFDEAPLNFDEARVLADEGMIIMAQRHYRNHSAWTAGGLCLIVPALQDAESCLCISMRSEGLDAEVVNAITPSSCSP